MIKARVVPINKIITKIVSNIKTSIDNMDSVAIDLNSNNISGLSMLSNFGPKFNIKLETVRTALRQMLFQNLLKKG